MLIVLAGGKGCGRVAKHLIDHHRFMGRNTLPRSVPSEGARVVVMPDWAPMTTRDRQTLARRTAKLGGLLVWLDTHAVSAEVTLPDPQGAGPSTKATMEKQEAHALSEVDGLVSLLVAGERVQR